jgi:hypothetical protein
MDSETLGPLFQRPPMHGAPYMVAFLLLLLVPAVAIGLLGLLRGHVSVATGVVGLLVLPFAAYGLGNLYVIQVAKETQFCGSCHVMEPIAAAIHVDDGSLAARHVALGAIPNNEACYGCHGGYGVWGGVGAKMDGIRHMFLNLTGRIHYPIEIVGRYDISQCLDCHAQSTKFRAQEAHRDPDMQKALLDGSMTCTGVCHAPPHPESALLAPGAKP